MNPITTLRDLLQLLPDKVRTGLYAVTVALGAVVAICHLFGVADLAVVTVDQLEQALVVLGPIFAASAAANVKRKPKEPSLTADDVAELVRDVMRQELITATRHGDQAKRRSGGR